MKTSQIEFELARVEAAIAAGLVAISEQLNLLSEADTWGDTYSPERRYLWALELEQARLRAERSAILRRIAAGHRASKSCPSCKSLERGTSSE